MKILTIKGKNLASLENEFFIDFTSEPLKSAGIFAITGNTGAGKSTIFDALCLALYDNAPRTNKVGESIQVYDVGDKTITQKDSRNILRRGAVDGYAEVDFKALNGDLYRSRWSVRRSRGKIGGALQSSEIKVFNLSTMSEQQGTKTELLIKNEKLIGLTFDQFTRAVLLAQGDFSTFLKAKQSEKAELLEKLTGTEIYSNISKTIYKNYKETEQALEMLLYKIKDIKTLPDDEIEALNKEKQLLECEYKPLKSTVSKIEKQLDWIEQDQNIKQSIKDIENRLTEIKTEIEKAKPREEYISKVDASLEIRDIFIDHQNKEKQISLLSISIEQKEDDRKTVLLNLDNIEKEILSNKTKADEIEKKYQSLKPEIEKAKELDMQKRSENERFREYKTELENKKNIKKQIINNITVLEKELAESNKTSKYLSIWFAEKDKFKTIIPKSDLIITLLDNYNLLKKQSLNSRNNIELNKKLLLSQYTKLNDLKKETGELEKILPTEIIELREKLETGKPCPVCGSKEHPLTHSDSPQRKINEEELQLAKLNMNKLLEEAENIKENTEREISQSEALLKNYETQIGDINLKIKDLFNNIPEWLNSVEWDKLPQNITELTEQWRNNENTRQAINKAIDSMRIKIEAEQRTLKDIQTEIERWQKLFENSRALLEDITLKRKSVLNGESIEAIEKDYSVQKEQYAGEYEKKRLLKENSEKVKAKTNGIISQLKADKDTYSSEVNILKNEIDNWLTSNNHHITLDTLKDLITKPTEWIAQEKNYLTSLKNNYLSAEATLKERLIRKAEYDRSPDKPDIDKDKNSLQNELQNISLKEKEIRQELTQIEIALNTDTLSKEKLKVYEKELKRKSESAENWKKLNQLLGSADGGKFKTIAQGYTLDTFLAYANKHLEDLTQRYRLERVQDSLALQVEDNDMLGEIRSVHSLSGGESFIVSLALALGLSSLSSNRIKIESLFIDEGFGSLDSETLNITMDALEKLQSQGRKIGVISHVQEMTERITAQIQVIKTSNGKSIIKIAG